VPQPELISRRGFLLTAAGAVAASRLSTAQEQTASAGPTFSSEITVVNVLVTVRDRKGAFVKDLVKEDFVVTEEDQKQVIRYFSRESDLPLTIGLIVDTTPSESNMLAEERRASLAFLNKMLRPEKDRAFVVQFSDEVELLQDVTSSYEKLEEAVGLLERHEMGAPGGGRGRVPQRGGRGRPAGGGFSATALADAIYLASEEIMRPLQGRKALLVLADGDHVGNREEMAIEAAQRANTLVYAIRIWDQDRNGGGRVMGTLGQIGGMGGPGAGRGSRGSEGGPGGGGPTSEGKKNLQRLSSRTGGGYYEVSKKTNLEKIYGSIEEELRNQYSLGYTPDPPVESGYRRITVAVRKKGLLVQSREGYYASNKR
jgi:VWFA-related protein